MKKFRIELNDKLNGCQEDEESLENLIEGYNQLRSKGGEVRFAIYPQQGNPSITTLSPVMEMKKNEAIFQYVKCCGCPFNHPYEPKVRGCGSETCFVDADYQVVRW